MKNLKQYIAEKLKINNIQYFPETREELEKIIEERIKTEGPECDLNDIDISKVTDLDDLFWDSKFDGDISGWNTSNVISMNSLFGHSNFTGKNTDFSGWDLSNVKSIRSIFSGCQFVDKLRKDISNWDVSNVEDMRCAFCYSTFDGDLSKWDVSKVTNMNQMFQGSDFTGKNGDISKWNTANVEKLAGMFLDTKFDTDISNWNVKRVTHLRSVFEKCPLENQSEKQPKFSEIYIRANLF